ncbi:MAG: phosphatase, partial [Actinobacteria bacterium]
MRAAAAARLDVVGLTDHDTFSGWEEAEKYVDSVSVGLLRGVEMSCSYEGVTVHLLAYLFDPSDGELTGMLSRSLATRQTRGRAIVENLSADYPITWEDVVALAPDGGPVGRPHIADALVNAGFFPNRSAVFEQVLHPRGPYYVHHWAPNPIEAVHAIREAGGVPILAH